MPQRDSAAVPLGMISGPYGVRACDLIGVKHARWSSISMAGAPMLPGLSTRGCRFAPRQLLGSLPTLARPRHPVQVSLTIAGLPTPTPSDAPFAVIRELRGMGTLICCFSAMIMMVWLKRPKNQGSHTQNKWSSHGLAGLVRTPRPFPPTLLLSKGSLTAKQLKLQCIGPGVRRQPGLPG
jgi:hypothetical protein